MACVDGGADGPLGRSGTREARPRCRLQHAAHAARRNLERGAKDRTHATAARRAVADSGCGRRHSVLSRCPTCSEYRAMRLVSCSVFAALLVGSVTLAATEALARGAGIGVGRGPVIRAGAAPLASAPACTCAAPFGKACACRSRRKACACGSGESENPTRLLAPAARPASAQVPTLSRGRLLRCRRRTVGHTDLYPLPENGAAGDRMSYPPICVADAYVVPSEAGGVRRVTVTRCNIRPRPY